MKPSIHQPQDASTAARRKRRNDLILIGLLLIILAAASAALLLFRAEGDTVTVLIDGRVWGEYALHEDRQIEIRNGDGYNLLVIENGRAQVAQASCPDGICSSHRPIGHDGESIICLPNKVVIEIHTQDRQQPDIIT